MRRTWIVIALIAVIAAGAYVVMGRRAAQRARQADPTPAVKAPSEVVAEARVVPIRGVTMGLPAGGTIVEVRVKEGEPVKAGQLLVRTEAARQAEASVAQAEAALHGAQARLAELRAGARAQDIESARAAVAAAEARYNQLLAGARDQERAQAQAAVEQAENRAVSARQRVVGAEAALKLAEDDLRRLEQLLAQRATSQQSVDQARTRVASARAELDAARAEQAAATAAVAAARQQASLVQAGARREELDAAAADVRRARAQLNLLRAGARPEVIAGAAADVAAAAAAVKQARVALAQAELRAPFDGTIAWLGPKVGEYAAPGAPVVRIGDLSAWQVETTDLTELSIVKVREGSRAKVTFDGIPDLELAGTVRQIKAFGENRQGDITYTVTVALDTQDPRLYWNMTASVAIAPSGP
ncbi:MAG: HlyD family efflux transporter periplasmic adaptor subunit [Armatimonadota bacterium]|nr:HlyD family efflux transporter periplasmic adaptor subunit [Armatimonadota bacterium]